MTYFFVRRKNVVVFLVKMRGYGSVLHSICIDMREQPGWIYEPSEPYGMRSSADELHVGDRDNSPYERM